VLCVKGQDVPAKQQHAPAPGDCAVEGPGARAGAWQDVRG
jgi:hypothetical protein